MNPDNILTTKEPFDLTGKPTTVVLEPPLKPPGSIEGFWQRSATKLAIGATAFLGAPLLHELIMVGYLNRETIAHFSDEMFVIWGGAFGIHKGGPESRRA